ncbi:MAG: chemotaxis protein CheX [Thermodesulfobacteriota bacterium]|nr:chemotaxis protein CheX [Thermodesulfobacteriota bacterium]
MKIEARKLKGIIDEAVTTTFSTMVFADVFPADPDPEYFSQTAGGAKIPEKKGLVSASLDITNPVYLTLQLIMRQPMAAQVTDNLLGLDEEADPPPEKIRDAVGELLNTIAGMMAKHLTPEGETFEISLPVLSEAAPPLEDDKTVVGYFMMDDTHLFTLAVRGDAL